MNGKDNRRRSIRLKNYDYSQAGAYFITICTQEKECLFGKIVDGEMVLNEYGAIVKNEWMKLLNRYFNIELDIFQIMPNHIHGIITVGATLAVALNNNVRAGASPAPTAVVRNENVTVGNIVGTFKSLAANEILKLYKIRNEYMGRFWQRNYYEHVIRSDNELTLLREYIVNNPKKWAEDEYYKN